MHLIPTGASLVAPLVVPGLAQTSAETVVLSLAQIRLLLTLGPLLVLAALGFLLTKGPFATKEQLNGYGKRIEPLERGFTGLREMGDTAHDEIRELRARIERQDEMIRERLLASLEEMKADQKKFLDHNAKENRFVRDTLVATTTTLKHVCRHIGLDTERA